MRRARSSAARDGWGVRRKVAIRAAAANGGSLRRVASEPRRAAAHGITETSLLARDTHLREPAPVSTGSATAHVRRAGAGGAAAAAALRSRASPAVDGSTATV